jgi:plasmid stabilization system protein ParE
MLKQDIDRCLEQMICNILKIKIGIHAVKSGLVMFVDDIFNHLCPSSFNVAVPWMKFAEPAAHDLANIGDDISQQSPMMAATVFTAVSEMLQKLQDIPELGSTGRVPRTREVQLYGYPITLVYTVDDAAAVTVVAILHTEDEQAWHQSAQNAP